jgi:hypothetical protein
MEALFMVPALASPQVNEKLIPALAKLIERNILLNNASLFRKAAGLKYERKGAWKQVQEDSIPVMVISDGFISENDSYMHQLGKLVLEAKSDEYINNMDREMQGLKHRYNNSKDNDERKKLARDMYELNRKLGDVSVKNDANKIKSNEIIGNRDTSIIQAKQKDAELEQKRAELAARIKQQEDMNKNSENQNTEMKRKNDVEIKKLQADIAWGEKEKGYKIRDYRDKNKKSGLEQKKLKGEIADRKDDIAQSRTSQSAEADVFDYKHTFSKPDDLEHPTGVRFFTQISLEPTYIDIPIKIGRMENKETFIVRVGVKCVPYVLDDVNSIVNLLNYSKNIGFVERLFKNAIRKINTKIWFTKARAINKGRYIDPDKAVTSVIYSPNRFELTNAETLAKSFTNRDSSSWSTMIILSSFDLEDNDHLVSLISNYRKLTKYVIGDIIITNETKESAYFCTPRMNHCQEIPFDYLKKVLNLKDVLDYSEASRASAWKKETSAKDTKLSAAVTESVNYKAVTDKVNDILKGF